MAKLSRPRPASAQVTNGRRLRQVAGDTMGTRYQLAYVCGDAVDDSRFATEIADAVGAVDAQMSTWKPESALSRFNCAATADWVAVPEDLARVVMAGQTLARQTRGAFDMTLGAAVSLWGFGARPRRDATPPTPADAEAARGAYYALEARMSPPALRKTRPLSLDLSGIAKGFGVDQIVAVLERHAIGDYFVVIDGELRLSGRKPGTDGAWRIALEAPVADRREVYDILEPRRACAVATSGDYRHRHSHAGASWAHSIDGRTGRPVDNAVASVSVAQDNCMMADAWATALLVLGPHDGVALAQALDIPARFLIREGEALRDVITGDFAAIIG